MKISINKLINKYTFAIFLLLYPLEIFNYYFKSLGFFYLPVGSIAYLLISLSMPLLFFKILKLKNKQTILYFIFINLFLLTALFAMAFSKKSLFLDYYLLYMYIIYLIFGYCFYFLIRKDFNKIFYISEAYVLCILIIFFYSTSYAYLFKNNYFIISEALVFILLLGHSAIIKTKDQYILFLFGEYTLYLINSRGSLIGYSLIFLIILFLKYKKKVFVAVLSLISLLFYIFFINYANALYMKTGNRVLRLFFEHNKDTSLNIRKELIQLGLNNIKENIFWGNFKWEKPGLYIHNILSFWSQFGFINFFSMVILILLSIIILIKNWKDIYYKNFTMYYFIYTLILIIMSKSYRYVEFFISLGLIFAMSFFSINERKKRRRKK